MKRLVLVSLGLMILPGCSSNPQDAVPRADAGDFNRTAPGSQSTPMASSPQAPPQKLAKSFSSTTASQPRSSLKPLGEDQCHVSGLQYLIGKPRTEIPVPLEPGTRRVVCSSCVTTDEFKADRQTISFDSETGLITSVHCG